MSASQNSASWSELLWGRNGLRSIALAGGVALHAVNVYIVATILPSVVQDIGGLPYYAWNMTLFVVASILSSALSPKSLDAFGPRHSFLLAIVVFALGTALCAGAPSMGWMLVGRTFQGLGGGLLLGLSYSSVRIVFDERLWPKAMALLSSMWGVATLAGPAIGGIFAEAGLWRWAFWAVLPVAAFLALLVQTQIAAGKRSSSGAAVKVPMAQIGVMVVSVLVVSIASLTYVVGWNALGLALGVLIGFGVPLLDKRGPVRLMPRGAYAIAGLGSIYACVALLSVGITVEIFVPYFLQVLHGHSPLIAGYLSALMSAGWTLGAVTSSGRGPAAAARFMRAGPIVSCASLAALAVLIPLPLPDYGPSAVWWVVLPLVGVGLGIGMCWPHLLTQVFRMSPAGQENMASSAIITVQLYAMALGATLGGMVTNAAGFIDPGGVPGTRTASLAMFVVFALAPGVAALLVGNVVRARNRSLLDS